MRKPLIVIGSVLLIVLILAGSLLAYVKLALPDVGDPEDLTFEHTPERIERGKYLANSVSVCMDCHSVRDWSKFSGPPKPGTLGQGGDRFDQSMGLPGVFIAKNITPFGISRYTDGELFRVITTGVTKEGRPMFPLMPYLYYGRMDREDIYDIIAYVRTLSPIESTIPESVPDAPFNFLIHTMPQKANPQTKPDATDELAYGAYMANASGCVECHSPLDKGQIIIERSFSGGRDFKYPDGAIVRSANITPDVETGIGKWSREQFIRMFKQYADSTYTIPNVKPGEFNTVMPWTMYANMKESDLSAIYTYLKTVKPISNSVVKFVPAVEAQPVSMK